MAAQKWAAFLFVGVESPGRRIRLTLPPGRLTPKKMKELSDEELHEAKIQALPGSYRWELATAEEQWRERLKNKKSPFPHWLTIVLTSAGLVVAGLAFYFNFLRPHMEKASDVEKAAQRAYLTYEAKVTNPGDAVSAVRATKDFFLQYEVRVSNSGLTPAFSVVPKVNFRVDADWTAVMITFPNEQPFELAPKESRLLSGQALFTKFRQIRKLPGITTGLQGSFEFQDIFKERQHKDVCFTIDISNTGLSSGTCGTVFQQWTIK
jgi:hypothetical protein